MPLAILRRHQVQRGEAQQGVFIQSEDLEASGIHEEEAAIFIEDGDAFGQVLHEIGVGVLGLLEGLPGHLPLEGVLGEDEAAVKALETEVPGVDVHGEFGTVLGSVPPLATHPALGGELLHVAEERLTLLFRADIRDRHRQEFLAAPSIAPDRGVIHREEPQAGFFEDEGRIGEMVEQFLEVRSILARRCTFYAG